jgi:hypothetical protein
MRHVTVLGMLILTAFAGARAQRSAGCLGRDGVSVDSLRATARRLHPDVDKPENRSNFVVVALVYDNRCTLVRHALKRIAREGDIGDVLAAVFPDSTPKHTVYSFEISGFAGIGPNTAAKDDWKLHPVVAWGILTPGNSPRPSGR